MKQFGARLLFTLLCTTILVFFSEKSYWYIYGYKLFDLIIFYFFPTAVLLLLVQAFRVWNVWALFLCGAVYGFVVEGVIVTEVYGGGPWDWFHISGSSPKSVISSPPAAGDGRSSDRSQR